MSEKVLYWEYVDSCEHCPGSVPEGPFMQGHRPGTMHMKAGQFRCKHDTNIVFQSNKDMGVPETCPKRHLPYARQ
jgi:hypothetical protein